MLNEKLIKLLNKQINAELYSAYLYEDFSQQYAEKALPGFQHWYHVQANEELEHALKFCNYLIEQGEKPVLEDIKAPKHEKLDEKEIAEASLSHEQLITSMIDSIYELASELKDYRTQQFLVWFINEQTEEEINAKEMVEIWDHIKGGKAATYFADKEVGKR